MGINSDAFTKYENLTIVKIPSTITEIDYSIFRENHKLREIRVDENSEYFEDKEVVLYNKITKEIIWIPEQTSAINIYVSKDTTKVEKELFDHMHELMTIHYEGSIVEWSNVTNSLLAPCRNFCSDGATKVNNVIYKYNIQDDSLIYKETKFLSGVGASLPSIGEMQINNYVFYGWFIHDQKTDIIDSNYTENVVVEGRYAMGKEGLCTDGRAVETAGCCKGCFAC